MPFKHDLAGGNGNLVATSLKSPNYSPGISGWSINKDGSAEFQSVTLPSDLTGSTVTFGPTAPASPKVGDVWYDTGNGLQASQWNGTSWVPYLIGTGAIGSGAVGTGQISFTARDIGGITTSVQATAPTGALPGDLWFDTSNGYQLNQYALVVGWTPYQYGTSAIAAGSITAALIAANTITASQIAAGTITANEIAANSITASLIGSVGPLNPNPFFTGGDGSTWFANSASSSAVTSSPPSPAPYPYAYLATASGAATFLIGQYKTAGSGPFLVTPATQYLVSGWIYSSVALTFNAGLDWLDSSFNVTSNSSSAVAVAANTWTQFSSVVSSPASGSIAARVNIGASTTPASGTNVYVAGITVNPQVPGTLIEANSIAAGQIAAGTVVAGIVDGTTIEGATLLAGTTGNPQVQITSSGGVGEIQFPLPSTLYNPALFNADIPTNFAQLLLAGPTLKSHPDWISHEMNSSSGTDSAAEYLFYNTATTPSTAYTMAIVDSTGFNITAGSVTGAAPGANPATGDLWHGLGVPSGWTGHLTAGGGSQGGRYVKMAEAQAVWIDIFLAAPSAGASGTITFPYSIASGWEPPISRFYPAMTNSGTAANVRIYITTAGEVQIYGLPSGFTGEVSASFPMALN